MAIVHTTTAPLWFKLRSIKDNRAEAVMARVCKRALVVAAMLVGGGAAASPPYQLCHTQDSGAPAAIAPEQNYRFPPGATPRHLGDIVRDRCDLPMSEAIDSGLC
jgi:hypothetical protein